MAQTWLSASQWEGAGARVGIGMFWCPACRHLSWESNVCTGSGHHERMGRCLRAHVDEITDPVSVLYRPAGTVRSVVGLKPAVACANKERLVQLAREAASIKLGLAAALSRLDELVHDMDKLGDSIEHERVL